VPGATTGSDEAPPFDWRRCFTTSQRPLSWSSFAKRTRSPFGIFGQPIERQAKRPLLGICKMLDPEGRDLVHPQQLRSIDDSMARNDDIAGVNQDRCNNAEAADRTRQLGDLLLRVDARVFGIRLQRADRNLLDQAGVDPRMRLCEGWGFPWWVLLFYGRESAKVPLRLEPPLAWCY
jgi:hypothetical protein